MSIRTMLALALVTGLTATSRAKQPEMPATQAAALAPDDLHSITFTATGRAFMFGQQPSATAPWPAVVVKRYEITLDYVHGAMRVEQVHTSATAQPRGGSVTIDGERRQILYARDGFAWSESVGQDGIRTATTQPAASAERTVWTWAAAPQGLAKAAGPAPLRSRSSGADFSVTVGGRYKVAASLDRFNRVTVARTRIPDDVLGDMLVEVLYSDYKDFGEILFPSHIIMREGGYPTLDLTVTDVKTNPGIDVIVPDNVRMGDGKPTVQSRKLSEGIYWLLGETHNSLAADMGDHIVVLEAPLNEEQSVATIAEIRKQIPNKPIRYVVNTHLHFDHVGGLRTFVDEGAIVVTHEANVAFLDRAWRAPRTLAPDRLSRSKRKWTFRAVSDRFVMNGTNQRTIALHALPGNPHDEHMLVAWLPSDDMLFQGDLLGDPASLFNFSDTLQRLQIRPAQIVGVHGTRPTSMTVVDTAVRLQRAKQKQP
jgi:glyoxylase-like metal-dependent hydrolase (beta-lactamase superfamily II)